MARCVVLQHEEPERPFAVGAALESAGVQVDVRRVFAGDPVPATVAGLDGVVLMGGSQSAATDEQFPSRRAELRLVAAALAAGVPLLGVCLGAQLLALAGGGSVRRGEAGPEIGWRPIELTPAAAADPLLRDLPETLTVLHWHDDTVALPPGAVHLASSDRYANQAFAVGPAAWGLQFHVEVDLPAVLAFVDAFGHEAAAAGVDPAAMAAGAPAAVGALAPFRDRIAGRFASLVSGARVSWS